MKLHELPDDLVTEIWKFLDTNKISAAMYVLCKNMKRLGDKYGYIKTISFTLNDNFLNFVTIWSINHKSIRSVTMENLDTPTNWLPAIKWPDSISFINCTAKQLIIPPKSNTKHFSFMRNNLSRPLFGDIHNMYRNSFNIQWNRLSQLETIKIKVERSSFMGLEQCTNLRQVIIVTRDKQALPECIAELEKLECLITNCYATKALEFKSTELNTCLMPTKFKLKSGSKRLPATHLLDNSDINIEAFIV